MRVRTWLGRLALALLALLVLLTAYGYYATREQPTPTRRITVVGNLAAPSGMGGTATVRIFQAWAGAGALRHPLEQLAQFQVPLGSFERAIDYPLNDGEGLVVYAWLDADGDGVHCTPSSRLDPAGLTQALDFPADRVSVLVELRQPCAGAEYFFPR